jgi:hypothetical protein
LFIDNNNKTSSRTLKKKFVAFIDFDNRNRFICVCGLRDTDSEAGHFAACMTENKIALRLCFVRFE